MRTVKTKQITENIREMCIEANHFLTGDMTEALDRARESEKAPLGKQILQQLQENLQIAGEDMIPICQDTGMAVVFAYRRWSSGRCYTGGCAQRIYRRVSA